MWEPVQAIPILQVSNLDAAMIFYTSVLGFQEEFRFEGRYGGLRWGSTSLHLSEGGGEFQRPIGAANVYFVLRSPEEVDALYAHVIAGGGRCDKEPQDYPYGMRDFVAFDPDGNILTFGADIEPQQN
jgi:uncharacterized glyoxalase superfamily protein PhnB